MSNKVEVSIVANLREFIAGIRDGMASEFKAQMEQMKSSAASGASEMANSMKGATESIKKATKEVNDLDKAVDKATKKRDGNFVNTSNLNKNLNETKEKLAGVSKELDGVASVAKNTGGAFDGIASAGLAISGILGVISLVKQGIQGMFEQVNQLDKLNDLSDRLGVSADKLNQLGFAAKLSGSSLESITGSLEKLTTNLGKANAGEEKLALGFKALGLDAKKAAEDPIEAFIYYLDVIGKLENEGKKNAVAMELFGRSFGELKGLAKQGSEGIRALMKESKELTGETDKAREASAKFNDSLDKFGAASGKFYNSMIEKVIPPITDLIEKFVEATKGSDGFLQSITRLGQVKMMESEGATTTLGQFTMLEKKIKDIKENTGTGFLKNSFNVFSGGFSSLFTGSDNLSALIKEYEATSNKLAAENAKNNKNAVPPSKLPINNVDIKPGAPIEQLNGGSTSKAGGSADEKADKALDFFTGKYKENQAEQLAILKASQALKKQELDSSFKLELEGLKRTEKEYADQYKNKEITTTEYYQKLSGLRDQAFEKEQRYLESELAALVAQKNALAAGGAKKAELLGVDKEIAKINGDIKLIVEKRLSSESEINASKRQGLEADELALNNQKLELANLKQIVDLNAIKNGNRLANKDKSDTSNEIEKIKNLRAELDAINDKYSKLNQGLDYSSAIEAYDRILTSESQSLRYNSQRLQLIQEQITALEKMKDEQKDPAVVQMIEREINALKAQKAQYDDNFQTLKKFKEFASDAFDKFFENIIDGTMTVKQSFKKMIDDINKEFLKLAFKELKKQLLAAVTGENAGPATNIAGAFGLGGSTFDKKSPSTGFTGFLKTILGGNDDKGKVQAANAGGNGGCCSPDSEQKKAAAVQDFAASTKEASENIEGVKSNTSGFFDKLFSGFGDLFSGLKDIVSNLFSSIGNLFSSSSGSGSGGGISGLFSNLFGGSSSGSGGGISGFFSNLFGGASSAGASAGGSFLSSFGGFFAEGGYAFAGKPYVIGEKGPEMFVPKSAGTIVPADQMGGGNVTVNMSISTPDAGGFRRSQSQVAADYSRALNIARRNA